MPTKGQQTRDAILGEAVQLASEMGLEGLTIGTLAKRVGMSKSGLYAHFDSKETLQCEVLDAAAQMFVDVVIAPALKRPRGLLRLRALFEHWLRWENEVLSGGCLFATASAELDDRPGPVRDHLVGHVQDMLGTIARAVRITIDEAHFRPDVEPEQLAFEMWSILLAYQQYERLLRHDNAERRARDAFERLVETSRSAS